MAKFKDLTGQVFNLLTVIGRAPNRGGQVMWNCTCACGGISNVRTHRLTNGETKSCGCLVKQAVIKSNIRRTNHGKALSVEYRTWHGIIQRCENPNNPGFKNYGGRAITICDKWRNSFDSFYADMGDRPTRLHSIERANNDIGYSACNCYWATRIQQANNNRGNKLITFDNKTLTISQWAELIGIRRQTLTSRISTYKWSIKRALTEPLHKRL